MNASPNTRGVAVNVDDLRAELDLMRQLFGFEAMFVDGDRWAALRSGDCTINLASAGERLPEPVVPMIKVAALQSVVDRAASLGFRVSTIFHGPHEDRAYLTASSGYTLCVYGAAQAD